MINAFKDIPTRPIESPDNLHGLDFLDRLAGFSVGQGSKVMRADQSGIWLGASKFADAPFSVDMEGNLIATSGGFGRNYVSTLTWTATDIDTATWSAGTIKTSSGTSYSISGGNTGNITVTTYVYLDPAVSTTVLQTSTTATDAAGSNKILIAIVQKGATGSECIIDVIGGIGTTIDGGKIVTDSITATQINVSTLSAISADLGTVTAGTINGTTITGATIRTASSGQRVQFQSDIIGSQDGLVFYDSGGFGSYFYIDTNGNFELEGGDVYCEASLRVNDNVYSETGTLKLNGSVIVTDNIQPDGNNGAICGYANSYWEQVVSNYVWYKNLGSFQEHDDIALIKNIKKKVVQLEESVSLKKENKGKTRLVEKSVWDEKTLPPEVYKDGFYNAGAVSGLIIGTLKQIIAKVEALEQKI